MEFSIATFSRTLGIDRIDAQYFEKKYNYLARIDQEKYQLINDLAYVSDGNHLTIAGEYIEEGGVRYLRGQDVSTAMFLDDRNAVYIPEENYAKLSRSYIYKGDVLVTIVGANTGCVGYVYNPPEKLTANCKLGIVRSKGISSAYIYAFLASKYGQAQIFRSVRGGGQTGLILPDLRNIKISILQPKTEALISLAAITAQKVREEASRTITQVQRKLLAELGLSGWKSKHRLSYVRRFSEIEEVGRFDAEHYQPKYDEVLNAVRNYKHGYDSVETLFSYNKRNAKLNSDGLNRYVEIGSVSPSNGEVIPSELKFEDMPANAKRKLEVGDVIISKVRTYRGAVAIISEKGLIGSSAFTALQGKTDINKETLFSFFKLPPILDLSLKYNSGTSYPVITDSDILSLPFPLIPKEVQKELADGVQMATQCREKSTALLDIARRGVEKAIEEGDGIAKQWLTSELVATGVDAEAVVTTNE